MQKFAERYFARIVFGIWLLAALAMLLVSRDNIITWKMGDPDDQMRLLQVRDWVAGQSWWDIRQYRMNAPDGGDMHWSRLVDVPLGLVIVLTGPFLGPALAEQAAVTLVPLLTLAAALAFYALATRRLFGPLTAVIATGLILTVTPITTQMAPMRIDHHGWQIMCFALSLWGLFDRRGSFWSGIILGLSCALWIEISVEGLPFAALLLAASAIGWTFPKLSPAPANSQQFPIAMASTAVGALSFFSVTESWSEPNYCDAVSPVHVAALATMAIIIAGFALAQRARPSIGSSYFRVGICVATAASGFATLYALAPMCAGDSFANLDPLVRKYWFNRTSEGLPIWAAGVDHAAQTYAYMVAGVLAFVFVAVSNKQLLGYDKLRLALLFLGTMVIGAFVSRTAVYAMAIANLFLAAMLVDLFMAAERRAGFAGRMGLRVFAILLAMPSLSGQVITNRVGAAEAKENPAFSALDIKFQAKARACQKSSAAALLGQLPTSEIMAGLDSNPAILQFTKHSVVASGHHRNAKAMADVIRTFTGGPDQFAQIIAARHIRFVVICDGSYELAYYASKAPYGMLAQLRAGIIPAWLRRQSDIGPFQVYAVVPSKLPS